MVRSRREGSAHASNTRDLKAAELPRGLRQIDPPQAHLVDGTRGRSADQHLPAILIESVCGTEETAESAAETAGALDRENQRVETLAPLL